jgi:hypothetical protein
MVQVFIKDLNIFSLFSEISGKIGIRKRKSKCDFFGYENYRTTFKFTFDFT